MKKKSWLVLAGLLIWVPFVVAQESEPSKSSAPKQEQVPEEKTAFDLLKADFAAAQSEFTKVREGFVKEFQAIKDDAEKQAKAQEFMKLQAENQASLAKFGERALALLDDSNSGAKPADVIGWVMRNVRSPDIQDKVAARVVDVFLSSDAALPYVGMLGAGLPSEVRFEALKKFAAEGATDEIKGTASLLVVEAMSMARDLIADSGDQAPEFVRELGTISEEELISKYSETAEKYGELKFRNTTIEKHVAKKLKAIEMAAKLKVGAIAPDIEGPDIDGQSFKLSDYRGKVVMLDFWGDW